MSLRSTPAQSRPDGKALRAQSLSESQAPAPPLLHIGNMLGVDVEGAPARLGQEVQVTASINDESVDPRYLGKTGSVRGLIYDAVQQYPNDPLVLVSVAGLGEELFFAEELGLEATALGQPATLRPRR